MRGCAMKIVDLTFPIKEGMLTFPSRNHPSVSISLMGQIKKDGRQTHKIVIGTHTGTHIDAPAHFLENGLTIDKLNPGILIGPAHIINLNGLKGVIGVSHLRELEKVHNPTRLIIRTGWSRKWGTQKYYTGYPYLSKQACRYIVEKKIKLLGFDIPSPDNPKDNFLSKNDSPNHKYLFKKGVILLEYLTGLEKINVSDFSIAALPLLINKSDAAPARVVAFWGK